MRLCVREVGGEVAHFLQPPARIESRTAEKINDVH